MIESVWRNRKKEQKCSSSVSEPEPILLFLWLQICIMQPNSFLIEISRREEKEKEKTRGRRVGKTTIKISTYFLYIKR